MAVMRNSGVSSICGKLSIFVVAEENKGLAGPLV